MGRPRRRFWPRFGSLVAFALAGVLSVAAPAVAATLDDHLEALLVQVPPEPVPAPAFTLPTAAGQPLALGSLRGQTVFLNFWATWCVPCRNEMPALEQVYQAYRHRGLAIVAVNLKESREEVQAFVKELRLTFPAVLDADGALARRYAVRGLPVSFLVDPEGKILWKALGAREWDGPHGRGFLDLLLSPSRP